MTKMYYIYNLSHLKEKKLEQLTSKMKLKKKTIIENILIFFSSSSLNQREKDEIKLELFKQKKCHNFRCDPRLIPRNPRDIAPGLVRNPSYVHHSN